MPKAKKNTLKSALTALNLQKQKAQKAAKASKSPYVLKKQPKGKPVPESASTAAVKKRPPPFKLDDHILCIGEGNFSFARSLCSNVLHSGYPVVATTLDTEEVSYKKYSDCQKNVEVLKELGAVVLFGVDGTKLEKYAELKGERFSKIIFNFPHAGAGIKDQDRNIVSNQLLLSGFFTSASHYLTSRTSSGGQGTMSRDEPDNTDGEIYVTLKSGKPYDLWDIKNLAKNAPCKTSQAGLVCKTSFAFDTQLYPGYEHRRTLGFQDGLSKGANEELLGAVDGITSRSPPRTYVFILVDKKKEGDIAPGYAIEDDDDSKGKKKTMRKRKGDRKIE